MDGPHSETAPDPFHAAWSIVTDFGEYFGEMAILHVRERIRYFELRDLCVRSTALSLKE